MLRVWLVSLVVMAASFCSDCVSASDESKTETVATERMVLPCLSDGSTFDLSKQKARYVVLHFLLKTECPFCLKHTRDYASLAATTPGVIHLFLKPDSIAEIKAWAGKTRKEGVKDAPQIYRDPDAKLAKQFGIPDGYKFHGQTVHFPALVVLDGQGKELFRYIGKDNSDRVKPKDFLAKLAEATAKR